MRRATVGLLLLAACGRGKSSAPWVTDPGVAGHAQYLLLSGTPHDPSAPGSTVTCASCHTGASFKEFDCLGCHGSQGLGQTALTAFHVNAGVTGFAWASAACYHCHPDGLGVPADHSTRFFPIGTASHPAVCSSCHTAPASPTDPTATTVANLACASCHRAQAAPGDLATLHAQVSAVAFDPATATSADCLACHADDAVQSVTAHQAKFPIAKGSGSHDTACLTCHTQSRADKPYAAADFTAFDCLACHTNTAASTSLLVNTDAQHVGVTGYVYASASCYGCHPDGTGAPANHSTAFFPIGAGSAHAAVSCTQCHTDPANRQDATKLGCAASACHAAIPGFSNGHAPVGGVAILTVHTSQTASTELSLTGANCVMCHGDSQVDPVASHPAGDSGFGKVPHQGAGCVTCHSAARTDKPFAADFSTTPGCVVCHPGGIPQ